MLHSDLIEFQGLKMSSKPTIDTVKCNGNLEVQSQSQIITLDVVLSDTMEEL